MPPNTDFPSPVSDVIIVNYKTPALCLDCLDSLWTGGDDNAEILVVDNASGDDSVEIINRSIADNNRSNTRAIPSEVNAGFSAGNNIGIKQSTADFILLLNSDTIVRPGAIDILMQTLIDNPGMGMASPRLEWPNEQPQESCFRFHRPINELIRSACTGPITKLLKRYEVPVAVDEGISYPEWTSFACVMIRREVLDDIGLLDEEFFMYFEDVDFCQRARRAGWNIIHNPNARVVHLRGGSSPVKSQTEKKKRLPRYFYESRTRYYYKYFGRSGLLAANLFWHLGWLIGRLRKLLNSSYQPNICESQWRDIWFSFTSPSKPYTHPDSNR